MAEQSARFRGHRDRALAPSYMVAIMKYVVVLQSGAVIGPYTKRTTAETRAAAMLAEVVELIPDTAFFGKPVGNTSKR
jgi:hypothetical protein